MQMIRRLAQKPNKCDWRGKGWGGARRGQNKLGKNWENEEETTGSMWKDFLEPLSSLFLCSRELKIVIYSTQ